MIATKQYTYHLGSSFGLDTVGPHSDVLICSLINSIYIMLNDQQMGVFIPKTGWSAVAKIYSIYRWMIWC